MSLALRAGVADQTRERILASARALGWSPSTRARARALSRSRSFTVVAHLVALGHTAIAHVAGPAGYVHSQARERAWRDTLAAFGLHPGPLLVGDFTGPGGAAATRRLLAVALRPTAVVYANDLMAIAGIGVALEAGVSVPDDLSIAGFDDAPLAAHVVPGLTTAREDVVGWGAAAADVLLALINGQPVGPAELDPPHLIVRASTGSPRAT